MAPAGGTTGAQSGAPAVADGSHWRHRLLVPVLLGVGMVVALVSSLGSPMVPTVAEEYGISLGDAQWTLTITLLAGSAVTPVLGRLGDGRYRRGVILATLAVVGTGGIIATIPGDFWLLLVGRFLQGTGLGLMPLAMAVARDHVPPHRSGSTVSMLSITTAAGVGIGYPVSAVCADAIGYHPTFLLSAGMAAVALVTAALAIPPSTHRRAQRVDFAGAALLAVPVVGIVLALSEMNSWGAGSTAFVGVMGLSALILVVWVLHERRVEIPIVNLGTLSNPSVRVAHFTAMVAGVGMYLLISMVIRLVQTPTSTGYGLGRSVIIAGMTLVPLSAASLTTNRLQPVLRRWPGQRWTMPLGCLVFIVALALFLVTHSALWQILVAMGLAGVAIGTVFASMPGMIVAAVDPDETGSSLGLNQVLRTIGFAVGSAASASVLAAYTEGDSPYPDDAGFTVVALVAIAMWVATLVITWPQARPEPALAPAEEALLEELERESVDAEVAGALIFELHPDRHESQP